MNNRPDDQILELFLQEMRQRLGGHMKQVILFSSRARGGFDPDSDYDCLAIVDEMSPLIDRTIGEITIDGGSFRSWLM
jgi:uncharacterized protein